MKAAAATDRGRVRPANEDAVFVNAEAGILIVADGMGGHAAGEVASELAVRTISAELMQALGAGATEAQVPDVLRQAIDQANAAIRERAAEDCSMRGMGTTLALALARGARLWLAHAGDSRVYLVRQGRIRLLTEDHSLVSQMVKAGQITAVEARKHHLRNVITRSLGFEPDSQAAMQALEWEPGDYLVLCSDGLTAFMEDHEIEAAITGAGDDLPAVCRDLIARANERGGTDNISVVIGLNA
jgi:protein phosphatase